ncbi:MAG TPA: hypothetical protein VGN12_23265 [Pirellulales bacterium]|jgi:hypothetical protein
MKWQLCAALIGSVASITGTAQAQHHNNTHWPSGTNPGWGAAHPGVAGVNYPSATALSTAGHNGHMNHFVRGAVEQAGYYRHGVPFAQPASVVNTGATTNGPAHSQNMVVPYTRMHGYGHEGLPYTSNRVTPRTNGDVIMPQSANVRPFEGNTGAVLRKEVQADKIAIKNDLATGNNVRLQQNEQRLRDDQRMEQKVLQQGYAGRGYQSVNNAQNMQQMNQREALLRQQLSNHDFRRQQFQFLHTRPGNSRLNDEVARIHAAHKGSSEKASANKVVKAVP